MFEMKLIVLGTPRLERQCESIGIILRKAIALVVYLVVTKGELSL